MPITRVRKRDDRVVEFDQERITDAIHKALVASGAKDGADSGRISDVVVSKLNERYAGKTPSVENIQDIVVETLNSLGYENVAKEYQAYRTKKAEIRSIKKQLKIEEDLKLTVNSLEVLRKRYLLKNDEGEVVETPAQLFRRVAHSIAIADKKYGDDPRKVEEDFYNIMSRLEFLPNSPTLFNAGTETKFALSACYVLPVDDSLEGIFTAVKNMALIEQTGGGVGFDFSRLRPKGDIVKTTKGVASGPVSFMRIFDATTEVIKAGGRRRGAMMAILRVDHPDILEFISAKTKEEILTNFNVSVAITDEFMKALEENSKYALINPRNGETTQILDAKYVWEQIIECAWKSGDPGIIFIDEINRSNPTPLVGQMTATNPCGEQPLLPYESCNLGSLNLLKIVDEYGEIRWDKFREIIWKAVHFLDNVIDVNPYPILEVDELTKGNRKIGLGVMGFAELLIKLGIPYDSQNAVELGEKISAFLNEQAGKASEELAIKRGPFPNIDKSIWRQTPKNRRNATVTTIAPTGTISIIAGCSSGIEPIFAIAFIRNVLDGAKLLELNPLFEQVAKRNGFYGGEIVENIARTGTLKDIKGVPEDVKRIFVTAHEISPEWHVKIQAAFQRHIENAVSKTVNLANDVSVKEVEKVFLLAHRLKCKGVTVYRYGSKGEQVLNLGIKSGNKQEYTSADEEYAGGKPSIICENCG
jgi:ribonucleoside-diphosphate reductase alpha chain